MVADLVRIKLPLVYLGGTVRTRLKVIIFTWELEPSIQLTNGFLSECREISVAPVDMK